MSASDEHLAARRILAVTEEELQRIILDIHDGPVQKLFAALSQVSLLQARASQGMVPHDQLVSVLNRVASLLESSLGEIKTSLGTFRPPEFARRDLLSVMEGLIIQHEEFTGCPVDFEAQTPIPRVGLPVKIALYRILQEALTNVVKHANGAGVTLTIANRPSELSLRVDNTAGPNPATGPVDCGSGLLGMRERAAAVGGTVSAGPRPDGGFRVTATLPTEPPR